MPPDIPTPPRPPEPQRRPPDPPIVLPTPDGLPRRVGGGTDQPRTDLKTADRSAPKPSTERPDPFVPKPGAETKKIDTTPATPTGEPETDHFARKDPVDSPRDSASRILDLSQGPNPVVKLIGPVRAQLEKIKNGTMPVGAEQARALSVLRGLADKTADRRAGPNANPRDQLEIVSYIKDKASRHTQGVAFDIAAYGGHRFNQRDPAESRQAVAALVRDLPPGNYGLGLPRLPTKYPISENQAHFKKYSDDMGQHPDAYQRIPGSEQSTKSSSYAGVTHRPTDQVLHAEDPHFRQPSNAAEIKTFGNMSTLDSGTRDAIREAATRGVFIAPFADGFDHAHLSVVRPGAKSF